MCAGRYLPEAGDAGRHAEPLIMMRLEQLQLVLEARPRADQRHVPAEDGDQLRQFVESRLAKPSAAARDGISPIELVQPVRGRRGARVHRRADEVAVYRV